jgi:CRP/FNR family transcriptional regulator
MAGMSSPETSSPSAFSVAETLARHTFFDTLAPGQLDWIASQAVMQTFQQGQLIFLEGDPCVGLRLIERGGVKVFKLSPEGVEHILHLLGPGDTFNEISALDGGPNPANAAAMTPATCWLLPSEAVSQALHAYPELALAVIGKLTQRVRILIDHIESLALYPVAARLARFLLQQADSSALEDIGVTRAAIAAHLAIAPETVSRVLRSFEEAGAIRFDRHHIVITNLAALRAIALL